MSHGHPPHSALEAAGASTPASASTPVVVGAGPSLRCFLPGKKLCLVTTPPLRFLRSTSFLLAARSDAAWPPPTSTGAVSVGCFGRSVSAW